MGIRKGLVLRAATGLIVVLALAGLYSVFQSRFLDGGSAVVPPQHTGPSSRFEWVSLNQLLGLPQYKAANVNSVTGHAAYSTYGARVYFHGTSGTSTFPGADPSTFFVSVDALGRLTGYAKDEHSVYYAGQGWGIQSGGPTSGIRTFGNADPKTFRVLYEDDYQDQGNIGEVYAEDSHDVYDNSAVVPGADPKSFVVYVEHDGSVRYLKDASHVYIGPDAALAQEAASRHVVFVPYDVPISGADSATFVLIHPAAAGIWPSCGTGCQYDAYDKSHKYFEGVVIQ